MSAFLPEDRCYDPEDKAAISSHNVHSDYSSFGQYGKCVMTCQRYGHHFFLEKKGNKCKCSSYAPTGFQPRTDCNKMQLKTTGLGHPVIAYDVNSVAGVPGSFDLSSEALMDTQALQVITRQ